MSTDKSTDSQKDIFSRLHKLFSETNQSLASYKAMYDSAVNENQRLQRTFDEQNETLRRYEETFGALPPLWPNGSPMAAQAPALPPGISGTGAGGRGRGFHGMPAPQVPASPGAPVPPWGRDSASELRSHIRAKFRDLFGWEAGEFLYSKIFAGDALK